MESQHGITRRSVIGALGAAALAATLPTRAVWAEPKKRKVLFFTKSSGFQHSVVTRKGEELSHAEKILVEIGTKHGFEVHATKDGTIFDKSLGDFDAYFFLTTGNLLDRGTDMTSPMSAKGKDALLEAVKSGKGFLGSHCASDTFHSTGAAFETQATPDPYIAMLGGEFIRHGEQQKTKARVTDSKFPGMKGVGEALEVQEEWYSLKNFAPDLHVIQVLETAGMRNPDYQRPPYPVTWARKHGKGRVWYTALGHREDVWTNPLFREMLAGSISWAVGDVEADVASNLAEAAPKAGTIPPEK